MENKLYFQEKGEEENVLSNSPTEGKDSKRKRKPRKKNAKSCVYPEGILPHESSDQSGGDSVTIEPENNDDLTIHKNEQDGDEPVEQCEMDQQSGESSKKKRKRKNRKRKSKNPVFSEDAVSQDGDSPLIPESGEQISEALGNETEDGGSVPVVHEIEDEDDDSSTADVAKQSDEDYEIDKQNYHEDESMNKGTNQSSNGSVAFETEQEGCSRISDKYDDKNDTAVPPESGDQNSDQVPHESGDRHEEDPVLHELTDHNNNHSVSHEIEQNVCDPVTGVSDEPSVGDPQTHENKEGGNDFLAHENGYSGNDRTLHNIVDQLCENSIIAERGELVASEGDDLNDDTIANKQDDPVACKIDEQNSIYCDTVPHDSDKQNCDNLVIGESYTQHQVSPVSHDQKSESSIISQSDCPVIDASNNQSDADSENKRIISISESSALHESTEQSSCGSAGHENDERYCGFLLIDESKENNVCPVTSEQEDQIGENVGTSETEEVSDDDSAIPEMDSGDAVNPEFFRQDGREALTSETSEQSCEVSEIPEKDSGEAVNPEYFEQDCRKAQTPEQDKQKDEDLVTLAHDEQNSDGSTNEKSTADMSLFVWNVDLPSSSPHAATVRKNRQKTNPQPQSLKRSYPSAGSMPLKRRRNEVKPKSKGVFETLAAVQVFCFLLTCHAACALFSVFKRKSGSQQACNQ